MTFERMLFRARGRLRCFVDSRLRVRVHFIRSDNGYITHDYSFSRAHFTLTEYLFSLAIIVSKFFTDQNSFCGKSLLPQKIIILCPL